MLDLIIPISDADFGELIEYMKTKCNIVSFRVPHFNKFIITENNIAYHEYCLRPDFNNVGDVLLIEPTDKVFTEYKENTRGLIASLEDSIIKTYLSEKYINQVYGHENEVYFLKFDDTVYELLKSKPNLYKWRCPNYPEDISFWIDDFCLCETISHENMCFFEDDDDEFFQEFYDKVLEKYHIDNS